MAKIKLGVNVDHIATLRQARGGAFPDPVAAAKAAVRGGADGITFHLREDRRHIQDADLPAFRKAIRIPLNLEMALNPQIIAIALRYRPEKVCIVPERRQELTTEGGLDAVLHEELLKRVIPKLQHRGTEVSLFIGPSTKQIKSAAYVKADAIEIHTGAYGEAHGKKKERELRKIKEAVAYARRLGLKVNAGHGLDYENVRAIARIGGLEELNIGHSIVSRSVFVGMERAVAEMKRAIKHSR